MHVCHAGRQFVPILWWSLVWIDCGANPRPTAWQANMWTTVRTWCIFRFNTSIIYLIPALFEISPLFNNPDLHGCLPVCLSMSNLWLSFLHTMTYNIKIRQNLSNKFGHLSEKKLFFLRNRNCLHNMSCSLFNLQTPTLTRWTQLCILPNLQKIQQKQTLCD